MSRLTKGAFENNFRFNLFGLSQGQTRSGDDRITRNSGWFNKVGERVGCGDLGAKDFQYIAKKLKNDELFLVLTESDTHFLNPPEPENINDIAAPGIDYVAIRSQFIIARNQLYAVDQGLSQTRGETASHAGLEFKVLSIKEAKELIIAA